MIQLIAICTIIGLAGLTILARRNAGYAIGVAWSTYALEQLLQQAYPVFWRHSHLVNAAIALIVLFAVLSLWLRNGLRFPAIPSEIYFIVALFLLCGISFAWSRFPSTSISYFKAQIPYLIVFVLLTPCCATDRHSITAAIRVTVYFGGLVLFGLLFAEYGRRGIVLETGTSNDVEGNPLAIASYASSTVICCVFYVIAEGRQRFRGKILIFAIACLGAYMVIRSVSRGQLLALAATLAIWLPITTKSTKESSLFVPTLYVMVFCVAGAVSVWGLDLHGRWQGAVLAQGRDSRLDMILPLLDEFRRSDIRVWLVGFGNSTSYDLAGCYPHNVPVEVLVEEGLLGLGLFWVIVSTTFSAGWKTMALNGVSSTARFHVGVLMALFSFHGILALKEGSLIGASFLFSTIACVAWVVPRYSVYADEAPRLRKFRRVDRHPERMRLDSALNHRQGKRCA